MLGRRGAKALAKKRDSTTRQQQQQRRSLNAALRAATGL
jgi:hypothetical protein